MRRRHGHGRTQQTGAYADLGAGVAAMAASAATAATPMAPHPVRLTNTMFWPCMLSQICT